MPLPGSIMHKMCRYTLYADTTLRSNDHHLYLNSADRKGRDTGNNKMEQLRYAHVVHAFPFSAISEGKFCQASFRSSKSGWSHWSDWGSCGIYSITGAQSLYCLHFGISQLMGPEACFGIFVRVLLGWLRNQSLYWIFPVNLSLLYQAVGTQANASKRCQNTFQIERLNWKYFSSFACFPTAWYKSDGFAENIWCKLRLLSQRNSTRTNIPKHASGPISWLISKNFPPPWYYRYHKHASDRNDPKGQGTLCGQCQHGVRATIPHAFKCWWPPSSARWFSVSLSTSLHVSMVCALATHQIWTNDYCDYHRPRAYALWLYTYILQVMCIKPSAGCLNCKHSFPPLAYKAPTSWWSLIKTKKQISGGGNFGTMRKKICPWRLWQSV